jgi:hypothetical protein
VGCSSCASKSYKEAATPAAFSTSVSEYPLDQFEPIPLDQLTLDPTDSLQLLFGTWEKLKAVEGVAANIITDPNIALLDFHARQDYLPDTTRFVDMDCFWNEGKIAISDGMLFEYSDFDVNVVSAAWRIHVLNASQLVISRNVEEQFDFTFYFEKVSGYRYDVRQSHE